MDVSSNFDGGALSFSVTGDGVSIDPETGALTLSTATLRDGVTVTVTATNSGGEITQSFRLDVALPAPDEVAPILIDVPGLLGDAVIGTEITVDGGTWSGTPAPEFTYQWLLDGVEIDGAVAAGYQPAAAQDGRQLSCRVTATNSAGAAVAETASVAVRHTAPQVVGSLADLLLDAGSQDIVVDVAPGFSGESLVFTVTGAGAQIDSATGLVTILADGLLSNEFVTVTASNSGGDATITFGVTVQSVAPSLDEAPGLEGSGVIGTPVTVVPGVWSGVPDPELSFRWICGGEEVDGANGAEYLPGPAEDGKDLVCEVTATNEGGTASATTDALALVLPAPTVIGGLADVTAEQGAPAPEVAAAAVFEGIGLVFTVEGADASIDAGTGLVTLATDVLRVGSEVVVTVTNSGGSAEARFSVSITEKPFVPVPPVLLAAPVLAGGAKVGSAMTVETGGWGGDPAPQITCQWLRDGAPIDEATGTEYLATPEDDLAGISCRVTATNAGGSAEMQTAALTVTHVAPQVTGELLEEILDEGTGPQDVPTAEAFEGLALVFAVEGADASIDAETGVASIPTDTPVDGAEVVVTATNSGGSAEARFLVTIEAIKEEPEGPPLPLADDQWQILRSEPSPEIAADSFRPVIALDPQIVVEAAQWTTSGQTPALPQHWETLAPAAEPNTFTTEMLDKAAGDWHVFTELQERRANFRIRYRLAADGAWSEESGEKQVPFPGVPEKPEPRPARASETNWHHVAHRTNAGTPGSFAMQFIHGVDRSPVNPDYGFMAQDVTQGWLTKNGGKTWEHVPARGVAWRRTAGCLFDPVKAQRFFLITCQKSYSANNMIWMTDNLGGDFIPVLGKPNSGAESEVLQAPIPGTGRANSIGTGAKLNRHIRQLIFYDPNDFSRFYFANPYDGLYRSNQGGVTGWQRVSTSRFGWNPETGDMGRIFWGVIHPNDSNVCLLACEGGLYRSENIKASSPTFQKIGSGYPSAATVTRGGLTVSGDWCTGIVCDTASNKAAISVYLKGVYETTNVLAANPSFSRTLNDSRTAQIYGAPGNYGHASVTRVKNTGDAALFNVLMTTTGMSGFAVADAARINSYGSAAYIGEAGAMDRSLGMVGDSWQQQISVATPDAGQYSERSMRAAVMYSADNPKDIWATANACAYVFDTSFNPDGWRNGSFGFDSLALGHGEPGGGYTQHMGFHPTDPLDILVGYIDEGMHRTSNGFNTVSSLPTNNGWTGKSGTYCVFRSPSNPRRFAYTVGDYARKTTVTLADLQTGQHKSDLTSAKGNHVWVGGHPTNDDVVYTSKSRTLDWGTSWQHWDSIGSGFPNNGWVMCASKTGEKLYASTMGDAAGLYRCTNPRAGSPRWTELTASGRALDDLTAFAHSFLAGIEIDPDDDDILYVQQGGDVYKVTVSGSSYSMARIQGGSNLPVGVESIRVDQYARTLSTPVNILYAMRAGYETGNGANRYVWRKINDGPWEDISFDLPRTIANLGMVVHPLTGDIAIGGTAGTRWLPRPSSVYGPLDGGRGVYPSLFSSAVAGRGVWLAEDGLAQFASELGLG